jgi:hypothetical protein
MRAGGDGARIRLCANRSDGELSARLETHMTPREALTIGTWAAGAFGIAMCLMLPPALNATVNRHGPTFDGPRLYISGAQVFLRQTPGGPQIVAFNPGPAPTHLDIEATVERQAPPQAASRTARSTTISRTRNASVHLGPGETHVLPLPANSPRGSSVSVAVSANGKRMVTHLNPR